MLRGKDATTMKKILSTLLCVALLLCFAACGKAPATSPNPPDFINGAASLVAYFGGEHHSSIAKQTTDRSGNICPTPTHYYKALLRTKRGSTGRAISSFTNAEELRAIVFWLQHADTGSDTSISKADCISVEELERRTGFTFFPMLDDAIEEKVKSTITPAEWGVY